MKTFITFLIEKDESSEEDLYRFDHNGKDPTPTEFYVSPDGTRSGSADLISNEERENWTRKEGLFAGSKEHVAPYAVPRHIRWVTTTHTGSPTIYFDKSDEEKIKNSDPPTLSRYNPQGFEQIVKGSREYFSTSPVSPIHREKIKDPLDFIGKHYKIEFVDNIKAHKKHFMDNDIPHDSEGL